MNPNKVTVEVVPDVSKLVALLEDLTAVLRNHLDEPEPPLRLFGIPVIKDPGVPDRTVVAVTSTGSLVTAEWDAQGMVQEWVLGLSWATYEDVSPRFTELRMNPIFAWFMRRAFLGDA